MCPQETQVTDVGDRQDADERGELWLLSPLPHVSELVISQTQAVRLVGRHCYPTEPLHPPLFLALGKLSRFSHLQ